MREELSSRHVLHEHVDMLGILGEPLEIYDEGVANRTQYPILVVDVIDLLRFDELYFFHDFGTAVLAAIFILRQTHCPERSCDNCGCTFSEYGEEVVVFEGERWASGLLLFLLHGDCSKLYIEIEWFLTWRCMSHRWFWAKSNKMRDQLS